MLLSPLKGTLLRPPLPSPCLLLSETSAIWMYGSMWLTTFEMNTSISVHEESINAP